MSVFKKLDAIDNQPRTILQPTMDKAKIIKGQLFSSGPFGTLPLTIDNRNEFPILESFDRACDHVGPKGIVYVYDPDDLWASEWPVLT